MVRPQGQINTALSSKTHYSPNIPNSPTELMSESPGFLLVEFCKGHSSNFHDNSTEFQEGSDERIAGATPIGEAGVEDSQELVGEGPYGLGLEGEKHQYGAGPHVFKASKSVNGTAREAIGYWSKIPAGIRYGPPRWPRLDSPRSPSGYRPSR